MSAPRFRRARARAPALRLALLLVALGAAGCSRIVVLTDPLSPSERNDLGVAYERAGEAALAERAYRRALRGDPGLVRARVNLGNLAAAAGRWEEAARCYRRALRDAPADVDARNNLAVALARRGVHWDRAEGMARSAVALSLPHDSLARATLEEVLAARPRAAPRRRGPPH